MNLFNKETQKDKAVRGATQTASSETKKQNQSTKKYNMIKAFIGLGNQGMNCFEAAIFNHDYILRTTISDLQKSCGLKFERKWESVPNSFGKKTECVRYWLDESNTKKALTIIGHDKESEVMQ
jgi:hypothetical protein